MKKLKSKTYYFILLCFLFSSCGSVSHLNLFTSKINGIGMVREKKNKKENVVLSHTAQEKSKKYAVVPKKEITVLKNNLETLLIKSSNKLNDKTELKKIASTSKNNLSISSIVFSKFLTEKKQNAKTPQEKSQKKIVPVLSEPKQKSASSYLYIALVVLICGLFIFLFVSILFGALIMFLGLVDLIIALIVSSGSRTANSKNGQNIQEYQDVVYLKNGGILRGMIIEQIPNVQLKIQTKDGSVFVYKMDEIEKITKELSKQP
jgi:hypothetical protein